jgi:hypothetical protein
VGSAAGTSGSTHEACRLDKEQVMRQTILALALTALAGAACAGAQPRTYRMFLPSEARGRPALYAQNQEFVCDYEMPTGSHISRTVCRTPRVMDAHRLASQELLQRWQMGFRSAQPAPH